ncbi:MAG: TetR family transcriptional regulator [Proteobacteria bacterium]|nr:TetR family transcriptional regulator [Pseudomonadota bacterium]MBU1737566.1 TetR family transcriptional regulator [Pseudomonadota bacterium]
MTQSDTKETILDKAEELFADKGYKGTSLRMITTAAEVNLAAVNYHFGSKEGLIAAVISRRIVPLNEERSRRVKEVLAKAGAAGSKPVTGAVLLAFIEPTLRLPESAPGARNFVTLVGRALADSDETARRIFIQHMGPAIGIFHEALARALPEMPPDILYWRLNFVIGALSHTLRCIDKCPMALDSAEPRNSRQLVELLLPFLTGGMEAPI